MHISRLLRMLEMNSLGKPYEGKLHVRFDEGGLAI
jgi:hypothetical protein